MQFFATHLVLEERILDIIRHFGHGQNVTFTCLVFLDADTIVERGAFISNQLQSARRELAMWVGVDLDHPLKQLRPSLVLAVTLECIDTLFP